MIKNSLTWWENHRAEDKMVTKHLSMVEELLNAVTPEPFTKVLCLLHDSRATTVETFKEHHKELMKQHWLDCSALLTPDKKHLTATGIFGKRTCLSASEMKEKLIDWMCDEHVELVNCMSCLKSE